MRQAILTVLCALISAAVTLTGLRSVLEMKYSSTASVTSAVQSAKDSLSRDAAADTDGDSNSTSHAPRRRRRWSMAELPVWRSGGSSRFTVAPFAVVMPIFAGELLRLLARRKLSQRPCGAYPLPVDLLFHYAGSRNETVTGVRNRTASQILHELARRRDVEECFHDVRVEYAEVDESIKYPEAACVHFARMFTKPERPMWGYSSVYQMECDVMALRPGWLLQLMPLFVMAAKGDAWVIGGTFNWECLGHTKEPPAKLLNGWRNPVSALMDGHINGNAIYSSDRGFLDVVWDQIHECWNEPGFDYAMSKMAKGTRIWRMWRDDPAFLNCKPPEELRNHTFATMPLQAIAHKFPNAWLVHTDGSAPTQT